MENTNKKINVRISKEEIEKAYLCLKNSGEGFIFRNAEHITKDELKKIDKDIRRDSRF
jgi:hypothetical protein